jgi:hypothetical protein
VAWRHSCQAVRQGQLVGRCSIRRLAERARRPAMVISRLRMVAVVVLACEVPARHPMARVRLNAIAASTTQAALALNRPEVIWSLPVPVRDVVLER